MKKQFRGFSEAIKFVHTLNLKNTKEWKEYCKSGNKPKDIPALPSRTYQKKWIARGDLPRNL